MNTRPIRFFHRGAVQEVQNLPPTTTVLQYLREHAGCTGTKEGCAEGDCGACTVIQGELGADGQLELRNVNACTQFLPTLDGRALLTVEDLGGPMAVSPALNPAQQAMVDCHGSQCGFCTPGFVMSLTACYETHQAAGTTPTRQQLADALAGNLCRCTGYRPILDAGERMFEAPTRCLDRQPIAEALHALAADTPLDYSHAGARFHAPQSIPDLALLRETYPQATLLAGSTDVGLWVNKQFRDLGDVIYTGRVAALREIRTEDGGLWIGAAASLEDSWAALTAAVPRLRELWLRFASPPVRHAGTLGGNIANGSPIGDGAPALIALGADVILRRGTQQRRIKLQDFYLDYMKKDLQPGEFVEAMQVPLPGEGWRFSAHKIAKRHDSDISAVCAVLALKLDGGVVCEARFAFGGMAAIVKRAATAEAAVVGQPWSEAAAKAAATALAQDFKPLTDMRASSDYRLKVAQNLFTKCWLETGGTALAPIGIWPSMQEVVA